jgi:VIT1/CCC1 family predicted Fe2+/Mn2+ transporter
MGLEDVYIRNRHHKVHKSGWLRAAVLGANDGLVANASLMIGVSAAKASSPIVTIGLAGIAAGAMSMAVGEYISVRSQSDIEEADRQIEIAHLASDPEGELEELTQIYIERGLSRELALEVSQVMTAHDALGTHLRDELGQFEHTKARPLQAGIASALSYTLGGAVPVLGAILPIHGGKTLSIVAATLLGLFSTGVISSRSAGSPIVKTTLRVLFGGSLGMAITAGIGGLVHLTGI